MSRKIIAGIAKGPLAIRARPRLLVGNQLGVPPSRIDLLTSITGVTFDEALTSRVEAVVGETRVNIIGRETLILNKRLTGRPQDKADIEALGASEGQ